MNKMYIKTMIILTMSACVIPSPEPASLRQMSATSLQMDAFFSPGMGCQKHIKNSIDQSKDTIDIAVYSITDKYIVDALYAAKKRGVNLRLLVDFSQASIADSKATHILEHGINLRVHSTNGLMHNKYAIFDGQKIVSGSYNWTIRATSINSENCIFISDVGIAQSFMRNFESLWLKNTEEISKKKITAMKKPKRMQKSFDTTSAEEPLSLF